uniref:MSP domain-containing protein n=1 Tax=Caenorhabditis tropicalis TaxID=1561998 RepID=A0A1I7T6F7_9PELO
MTRLIFVILLVSIIHNVLGSVARPSLLVKVGEKLEITFYKTPEKITRIVRNENDEEEVQVFTVCNESNKTKCGYWENTETKKKVGPVTNIDGKKMVIPKVGLLDAGEYSAKSTTIYTVHVE